MTGRRRCLLGALLLIGGSVLWAPSALTVQLACPGSIAVELRPGYPGYRGLVTGLVGIGDVACLDDLEAVAPGFDRQREDRANQEAGRQLGLSANMDLWTWEAWLAVEAARGFTPQCYSCFFFTVVTPAQPPGPSPIAWDDPRLLLGTLGGATVASRFAAEQPDGVAYASLLPTDYELRVMASLLVPGAYLDAGQLLDIYEQILTQYITVGGATPPFSEFPAIILEQGGYVPVPPSAVPDDQVFLAAIGLYTAATYMPQIYQDALVSWIEREVRAWYAELLTSSDPPSFAEWLRTHGAEDFFGSER